MKTVKKIFTFVMGFIVDPWILLLCLTQLFNIEPSLENYTACFFIWGYLMVLKTPLQIKNEKTKTSDNEE